jgi:antitoxin component YwqK of YwqJK toxin-antitoxin module
MRINIKDITFKSHANDGSFGIHFYNGEIFTGTVFDNWGTSNIVKTEYTVLNGKQEGNEKCYFENGKPESETQYKNGLEDGLSIIYTGDGNIAEKIFFEKGIMIWSEVYEDDNLMSRYDLEKDSSDYKALERLRLINNINNA